MSARRGVGVRVVHGRPRRPAKPWRLRDVLILTLPPALIALSFLVSAVLDYRRLYQFDDWWSVQGTSRGFLSYRVRSLFRVPELMELDNRLAQESFVPGTIDLRVNRRELDGLVSDPIVRWGQSIEAGILGEGRLHDVDLKLRGDTSVHWSGEKKSFRIRSPKDRLFHGRRDLLLSIKEPLPGYVAYGLARELGALAPESEIVPVLLNGRFFTVAHALSPIDEGFLRRAGLMPGNVFRGDAALRGERFEGVESSLFHNPSIWDRTARNDRPGDPGDGALSAWLPGMGATTIEEYVELSDWFEGDELARVLAILLVVGDPYHMDDKHNQFWYLEPSSGRLRPIVWDVSLHLIEDPLYGHGYNALWRTVLRDPRIADRAFELVGEWYRSGRVLERAAELVRVYDQYRDAFAFDELRKEVHSWLGTPRGVLVRLEMNRDHLLDLFQEAHAACHVERTADARWAVDVRTASFVGVELAAITVREGEPPERLVLVADTDADGLAGPDDPRFELAPDRSDPATFRVPDAAPAMLAGVKARRMLELDPVHYRWFVEAPGPAPSAEIELDLDLRHRHTKEPAALVELPAGTPMAGTDSFHPWRLEHLSRGDAPPELEWAGRVLLSEDVVIPEGTTLRVRPGTRVVLAPDVSVVVRGKLLVEGESDNRVVFENEVAGRPWGTLALQGEGASGSRIVEAEFRGGGGAFFERVEYKGMVCVHHAHDVDFVRCEFSRNLRCDDALNAVSATVDLLECEFRDTNADAVDYDLSSGRIEGCIVERAGNDGFDLMTCTPELRGNRISGCGDKGVSVGEGARPVLLGNVITECAVGIEIKDTSRPWIVDNEVSSNGVGLRLRRKNWRYGAGGWPVLAGGVVGGNTTDLEMDEVSRLSWQPTSPETGDLPVWVHALAESETSARVLARESYEGGLGRPPSAWTAEGGLRCLEVWERDLVAHVRGASVLTRPLELPSDDGERMVLLELSGADLLSARAAVTGADGPTEWTPLPLPDDVRRYSFVALPVPSDLGDGSARLVIEVEPRDRRGRFMLHGWALVEVGGPAQSPR